MICLYLISYSIEHMLLFKGLLGLSLRFLLVFHEDFSLLESFSLQLKEREFFVRFFSFVRSFVSWIRVVVPYKCES